MKKRQKNNDIFNHYSIWKYVVIIITIILLTLSALPTWYGEKPAIQVSYHDSNNTPTLLDVKKMLGYEHINPQTISLSDQKLTVMLADEDQQAKAKKIISQSLAPKDVITFSYLSLAPQWFQEYGFKPLKLGLDLRGGVQFLLNVDLDQALNDKKNALFNDLKIKVRTDHLSGVRVVLSGQNNIEVQSASSSSIKEIKDFINAHYPEWQCNITRRGVIVKLMPQSIQKFETETINQNLKIMRSRIEELGITEALVQRQNSNSIRIELPGVQDPTQAKNIIGATASLAFYKVNHERQYNDKVLKDERGQLISLTKQPVLKGEHIIDARARMGEMGSAEVNISLDQFGGKKMSAFSATHIGKPMATVFKEYRTDNTGKMQRNEKVISVATIQSQLGNQFRITGAGSLQDAQELALLLRAGSLTAPVTIVEERTIGASLGAENISNGFAALALGMGLTLSFMALWYRRFGWVANVALIFNMVSLLGLIALLPGAILTLPGIAGLVLTVGMAVDTNVIIFERVRDKLKEGYSLAQAVNIGFSSAFSTILDANVTTMISAVVLYAIGNGPIQGFALTLGLGLVTSMFTGIFVSRSIINLVWGRDSRKEVRI
ncbi:protein translocase subunit SecD [Vibrio sp. SS-MA-C1-2]|uniref:protein translocase subunit SecD n=1 Tax=Vibrio sp. SS-MA-C1-2 TaxID=2908646 RepID=UPI001F45422D|nr:protein translocase subunit SecD [Vibrio sp. SS-MA-C1-2]UJF16814.1 protein translocase subunit SecD [Vibrio sp. SS-MA-C1-2]